MIPMGWPEPDARTIIEPQPTTFGLLPGDLQPFPAPESFHPLVIDRPTLQLQQAGDPSVAIAAKLTGQFHYPGNQGFFVSHGQTAIALRSSRLSQSPTGTTLGNLKLGDDMCYCPASPCRA